MMAVIYIYIFSAFKLHRCKPIPEAESYRNKVTEKTASVKLDLYSDSVFVAQLPLHVRFPV